MLSTVVFTVSGFLDAFLDDSVPSLGAALIGRTLSPMAWLLEDEAFDSALPSLRVVCSGQSKYSKGSNSKHYVDAEPPCCFSESAEYMMVPHCQNRVAAAVEFLKCLFCKVLGVFTVKSQIETASLGRCAKEELQNSRSSLIYTTSIIEYLHRTRKNPGCP